MSQDDPRSRLLSEALELALDVAKEGADNLSQFLSEVNADAYNIAEKAGAQMNQVSQEQRDKFAKQSGQLANDAVSAFLDAAVAAKKQLDQNPKRREQNLEALSALVGFVGSMFIDTANRTVGTAAGQPIVDRVRQITVKAAAGEKVVCSAWVVNRGALPVSAATVRILSTGGQTGVSITPEPTELTIDPLCRAEVRLTVTAPHLPSPPFTDSLLIVDGVGSIVVRTIVTRRNSTDATAAAPTDS
jgi:hypothetical protein